MLQGQHNRNFEAKLWQFFLHNINKLLTVVECFSTKRKNYVKNITFYRVFAGGIQQHFLYFLPQK